MGSDLHLARIEKRRSRAIAARHFEFHFRERTFLQTGIAAHAQLHWNILRADFQRSIEPRLFAHWRKDSVGHSRERQIKVLLERAGHREGRHVLRRKNAARIACAKIFFRSGEIGEIRVARICQIRPRSAQSGRELECARVVDAHLRAFACERDQRCVRRGE